MSKLLSYWDSVTEIHYTEIFEIHEIAPEITDILLPRFQNYWGCSRDLEITDVAPEI